MKESLLLLCMTYPEYSRKYGASVCMAGITSNCEFRRIYPVTYDKFGRFGFHKREIINYEIKGKGDYRKESYKIRPETLERGKIMSYDEIRTICNKNVTTIEDLKNKYVINKTSLGIIKPDLNSMSISLKNTHKTNAGQRMLNGCSIPLDDLKYSIFYRFKCDDNCKGHKCTCLDTEVGQLQRKLENKHTNQKDIKEKLKLKFYDWMKQRDLYFMMGTVFGHPNTWTIISLLYPKKQINENLGKWIV